MVRRYKGFITLLYLLYKVNINHCAFEQFPCLISSSSDLHDNNIALCDEYLENLHENVEVRFSDLIEMDMPTWIVIVFEFNFADVNISLQSTSVRWRQSPNRTFTPFSLLRIYHTSSKSTVKIHDPANKTRRKPCHAFL